MSNHSTKVNAQQLDPNMKLDESRLQGFVWHSPDEAPLRLSGFAWYPQEGQYRRMPMNPGETLPPAVDQLANCTAGGQISFRTDSPRLAVSVELSAPANMYHMPATGQCGVDVYLGEPGRQRFLSTARFDRQQQSYEVILYELPQGESRHVTLNLPLYQGVKRIMIGIDEGSSLEAPVPYASDKKVVIYGTSITQGGCASRPGMAYPNLLSRRIPLEFINLGFSGNGRGEPEVARTISEIEDPALFVLDYEANAVSVELYEETLPAFIRILREAHPDVPILVVSKIKFAAEFCKRDLLEKRLGMKKIALRTIEQLEKEGARQLHFFDGEQLLGEEDFYECTVDGVHPTDLGFLRMADNLSPALRQLLQPHLDND
ncbi:SGNH/GDSL hydrolase family protein [Paenibacillus sp. HB172176]|uniref:SGNH/GDSL hydrolase family protein n=1 Tax=Paenibacillus sp. HB172176 TaxID=2493690 RepID=UPI00143C9078|nr:SGNH/GDSL hydrolase family protein [Paenibacillus sp. HB172176]